MCLKWAAVVVVATGVVSVPLSAQKGGGTKVTMVEYPAEITFWSRAEDGVKSDGAPYTNGVNGLKVVFQDKSDGTGSKNFLLNMSRSKGRALHFDYTGEVATSCDAAPNGPAGTLTDRYSDFWILNVMTMPVGSTIAKQGTFATAVGNFRFHDETKVNPHEAYHCAQLMVVTRVSRTEWHVTTDVDPNQSYFNTAGVPVNPGSIVQLMATDNATFLGNYRMTFGATITCGTCPAPQ